VTGLVSWYRPHNCSYAIRRTETAALGIVGQLRGIGLQLALADEAPDFARLRQTILLMLRRALG
jgi:hypothetical protein